MDRSNRKSIFSHYLTELISPILLNLSLYSSLFSLSVVPLPRNQHRQQFVIYMYSAGLSFAYSP